MHLAAEAGADRFMGAEASCLRDVAANRGSRGGHRKDERVGRPIALVLAVVAFELARHGRDRQPDLADKLGRALIKTNHGTLGIGRLGIEVEHVLHAGHVIGVNLRNTPHVLAPNETGKHGCTGSPGAPLNQRISPQRPGGRGGPEPGRPGWLE
jgi:hypothetical protein